MGERLRTQYGVAVPYKDNAGPLNHENLDAGGPLASNEVIYTLKLDANGDYVVEKVVYVNNKEKMAEMEKEIEKEINQVKATFDRQKELIR